MVAKKAWIPAKGTYSVGTSNEPFNPTIGDLSFEPEPPRKIDFTKPDEKSTAVPYQELLDNNVPLEDYMKVASLANLANVHKTKEGEWAARGDPTEIAIQVFACRFDWSRLPLTTGDKPRWKQLAEFPFDSDVKKMSVIFKESNSSIRHVFTKGAVERVILSCTSIHLTDHEATEMTEEIREDILENMESLAALGLRVLALASRTYDEEVEDFSEVDRNQIENNLTFRGLVGLYDPPRPESAPSVRACHGAGIAVHMLTGDHPGTARAIAAEVGIIPAKTERLSKQIMDSMVMTATQFDKLPDEEIDRLPVLPLVIARCAPNTKVRMIEALHRRKKFAAMVSISCYLAPLFLFYFIFLGPQC